ncbi:sugar fermentation stimulation protein A [Nitratiruptor sp. YY08-26]|uniref:DNA/RNA nuclease SfsA n=1 Tax=unclassified Nitratiruptor TaxID=2624044 RepID=UPI0019157826|nr:MULTISPECIES: DNA/RNA nuclease SfsA [unclassified Nitratiruptor]BCD63006.1 sugar fermentation stimulation protein A [Nitratiruptor sp. YY08-13]BCD66941.1 sugar fermentation stimulation protein A [Nitratiruptor sp. YY08-26]
MILFDLKTLGKLTTGSLIKRENRFLATALVHNQIKKVHIADTGRLEEILTPNRELLLLKNRPGLKTDYTLIAAKMEEGWVLINTKLHRPIAQKAIEQGVLGFIPKTLQAEVTFQKSRLDFKADNAYIELKGCSLVQENICLFPNAPTSRGVKHIQDLIQAKEQGFDAYILIMAVRQCNCFKPHPTRDPTFKAIFTQALAQGVGFKGFFIRIDTNLHICYDGELPLCPDEL